MKTQEKCAAQIQVPSYLSGLYKKGYTLKEASEVLGCTHGHLARVLKGERKPSADLLGRLKDLPRKQLVLRRRQAILATTPEQLAEPQKTEY